MATVTVGTPPEYWNSNVAHHPLILDAVPSGCRSALDVGCGEGLLAVKLAEHATRVVGVDLDAGMIDQARQRVGDEDVELIRGDFLAAMRDGHLVPASFDFVTSVMCLMDLQDQSLALKEFHRVLRRGGHTPRTRPASPSLPSR